jgi:hypothetical protein
MATAPIEADEGEAPDLEANDNAPRDYEAEARKQGWTPKEEFKGDESRFVDAETFVRRAEEITPLIKKQNQALKSEIEQLKKSVKQVREFATKAEERAYNRAIADLEAKMEDAGEMGDNAKLRELAREMREIEKPSAPAAVQFTQAQVARALLDFRDENPWYDEGGKYADYAALVADEHKDLAQTTPPHEFFKMIGDKVRERYPEVDKPKAERARPRNPVEGVTNRGSGTRGRSFADLPVEAQRMAEKWEKQGFMTKADYVKGYQWA